MPTPTNDFVPFCSTDTGTNLLSQTDYLADPQLPIGNQTGVARSKLVNKALRQATYIASCLAQFLADSTGNNVLDDATPSEVLATMGLAFKKQATVQKFLTGAGTYTRPAGVSYIRVRMVGGGGGGGGGSSGAFATAGDGTATTFGTALLTANGGKGGSCFGYFTSPNPGGTATAVGLDGIAMQGNAGPTTGSGNIGLPGASGPWGGSGTGANQTAGGNAAANSGAGGGGGAGGTYGGQGGASGGFIDVIIPTPAATYSFSIGAGGAGGTGGTYDGGNGGSGVILVEEFY